MHTHALVITPMPAWVQMPGEYVPLFKRSQRVKRYGIPRCLCGAAFCPTHKEPLTEIWGNTAKWAFKQFLVCPLGCVSAVEVTSDGL
jgi:hypothetical protein